MELLFEKIKNNKKIITTIRTISAIIGLISIILISGESHNPLYYLSMFLILIASVCVCKVCSDNLDEEE